MVRVFPLDSLSYSHVSSFLFELCSWILCYAFKSAADTVAGAIVVVVDALVNFPVLENYADFLLEFCVGTLGIGAGSSRLEENPEVEDAVEEGAVHVQPHPWIFCYFSIST